MNSSHRRSYTTGPQEAANEEITSQIDRLNFALETVMKEIEISSVSRNPSRMSAFNTDLYGDPTLRSEYSDDDIHENYSHTIEKLLQNQDRQQMVIEDLLSEGYREKVPNSSSTTFCPKCSKNAKLLRSELWEEFSKFRDGQAEKDRKKLEENLSALEEIKEDYLSKKKDIMTGSEKLKIKERLLSEKEKELRTQRLSFEKQKNTWEKENGIESLPEPIKSNDRSVHVRASSFSYLSSPLTHTPEKPIKSENQEISSEKQEILQNLQNELRELENEDFLTSEKSVQIESVKNKIARIRAELAMSESSKATRLINSMMISMQKEVQRDEKIKRLELVQTASKNIFGNFKNNERLKSTPVKAEPLSVMGSRPDHNTKDAPVPKCLVNALDEKFSRKGLLVEKEKELAAREALLQETWMKIPGAKDLIENVNLTLTRLTHEKKLFEKEREDFYRERREWLKAKSKN
jgi:hypothetical protein